MRPRFARLLAPGAAGPAASIASSPGAAQPATAAALAAPAGAPKGLDTEPGLSLAAAAPPRALRAPSAACAAPAPHASAAAAAGWLRLPGKSGLGSGCGAATHARQLASARRMLRAQAAAADAHSAPSALKYSAVPAVGNLVRPFLRCGQHGHLLLYFSRQNSGRRLFSCAAAHSPPSVQHPANHCNHIFNALAQGKDRRRGGAGAPAHHLQHLRSISSARMTAPRSGSASSNAPHASCCSCNSPTQSNLIPIVRATVCFRCCHQCGSNFPDSQCANMHLLMHLLRCAAEAHKSVGPPRAENRSVITLGLIDKHLLAYCSSHLQ